MSEQEENTIGTTISKIHKNNSLTVSKLLSLERKLERLTVEEIKEVFSLIYNLHLQNSVNIRELVAKLRKMNLLEELMND